MSELVVEIPDVLKHYYGCEDFFQAIPYDKLGADTRIIFNMQQVRFINPFGLLLLMLVGRNLHQKCKIPICLASMHEDVYKYLERMDFFSYTEGCFDYNEYFRSYQPYNRSDESQKLIEIMPININSGSADVYSFVGEFRRRANSILGFWLHRMDVDIFVTVISEICQNIFEHSESTGYVALQTYKHSIENSVILAVCDMGIGVKTSLIKQFHDLNLHTTADYIHHALYEMQQLKKQYNSQKRNHFGLSMVRRIIQEWNGYLFIRSHDGSVLISPKYPFGLVYNCKNFCGTQISIRLSSS